MVGKYALSLFDYESLSLIEVFLRKLPKVKKLFILSSGNTRMERDLKDFSKKINVKVEITPIYDKNNFFEVYLMLEKICEENGFPSWVNIASGSGMALSALTLHAYFKDALLVIFDKFTDTIITTDVNKLKKIKIYKKRYFELINHLERKNQTTAELAGFFKLSPSSMSRRLKHMEMFDIVTKRGLGRANSPYVYQLTDFGKRLL
jgi:DNA-binding MarR family transcriptional regulator